MSTSAQKQEVSAPKPGIVNAVDLAPVVQGGIVNTSLKATDKQVETFAKLIRDGKPTGKIFPGKLRDMEFTEAQREMIQTARRQHKESTVSAKKELIKRLQSRQVRTVSDKMNSKENRGAIGWVHDSAFQGKNGKFSNEKYEKFLAGHKMKAATA